MKVNIKKLVPEAVIPQYAKQSDAGLDLTAVSKNMTDDFVEYGTGLSVEIPDGYVGLLFPRSSVSKYDLVLANSVGVVDAGYRGEVKLRFKHLQYAGGFNIYKIGDKVAQLIIPPIPKIELIEVDELSDSERGEGGFGHTGK